MWLVVTSILLKTCKWLWHSQSWGLFHTRACLPHSVSPWMTAWYRPPCLRQTQAGWYTKPFTVGSASHSNVLYFPGYQRYQTLPVSSFRGWLSTMHWAWEAICTPSLEPPVYFSWQWPLWNLLWHPWKLQLMPMPTGHLVAIRGFHLSAEERAYYISVRKSCFYQTRSNLRVGPHSQHFFTKPGGMPRAEVGSIEAPAVKQDPW